MSRNLPMSLLALVLCLFVLACEVRNNNDDDDDAVGDDDDSAVVGDDDDAVGDDDDSATSPGFPPLKGLLRVAQNVGVYINDGHPSADDLAAVDNWKEHLDGLEITIGGDWKVRTWDMTAESLDDRATDNAKAFAEETRDWLELFHSVGMQGLVSIGWQGSLPGASSDEMEAPSMASYRFSKIDLKTGERYEELGFDWSNPAAVDFVRGVFTDVSTLIGPTVDWLFINEIGFGQAELEWHQSPVFSDAAIADFRTFTGTDSGLPVDPGLLPEGVSFADPDLYNQTPSAEDWALFDAWRLAVFKRKMETLVDGFAAGQAANPEYQGAVWFQQYDQVHIDVGELDAVLSIPGIRLVVPEYLLTAVSGNPTWDIWTAATEEHDKELGAFVAMSKIDIVPGPNENPEMTYVPAVTTSTFDHQLGNAAGASDVPMLVMYYAGSFDPNPVLSGESYSPELIDVWDDWTHPDGPDADPIDWTVTDE